MSRELLLTSIAVVIWAAGSRADEAVRRDGSRVTGQLRLTDNGRLAFRSPDREEPIADIEFVRFGPKVPAAPPLPLWHQIHLGGGQVLLGAIIKLDATDLTVRTAWRESLTVPRTAIDRVTNVPGARPILFDAFTGDLSAWESAGGPRAEAGKLQLNRSGQSVNAKIKQSLAAGAVSVGFESARTTARRVVLELHFERDGKPNVLSVELTGPDKQFKVVSSASPAHEGKLVRAAGSQRLSVEFDKDRLDIFIDDLVLWSQRAAAGVLQSIKLSADGNGTETAAIGSILVSEPRATREFKSWADLTADAIRSPDGDETFGELVAAGPAGVTMKTKGRDLALPWPSVAEFTFRRGPVAERATTGEHVTVRVRSADGVRDVLTGAVKTFDERSLVLSHPVLGDLAIPRNRVEEIRLLYHGRQIPIDTTPRHLGDRAAFGFAVPKPEGLRFTKKVTVQKPAATGFVSVDAAQVGGKGTPVEVRVAGESIGTLNRLADRADFHVRTYRLPLPAVRDREFEVELELRPPKDGGRVNGIDLRALRLELHDER